MTSEFVHTPVLLSETIDALQPRAGGRYVDATVGGGGHAEKVLEMSTPGGMLLGIDADPVALGATRVRLSRFSDRITLVEAYFDELASVVAQTGIGPADGVLFDLGVSSPQLDTPERGFSFQYDAPLDMRLGPRIEVTAADLLNTLSEQELFHIFRNYGEERYAGRIARRIVEARANAPIHRTGDLVDVVMRAKPHSRGEHIHPATRVFQGLRIAVNDELDRLQRALPQALEVLRAGGRLVVISFHSLEDRIVKQFMRRESRDCICPPELPTCICGHVAGLHILTPKPIVPGEVEIRNNHRARSAKLRIAEKISPPLSS